MCDRPERTSEIVCEGTLQTVKHTHYVLVVVV